MISINTLQKKIKNSKNEYFTLNNGAGIGLDAYNTTLDKTIDGIDYLDDASKSFAKATGGANKPLMLIDAIKAVNLDNTAKELLKFEVEEVFSWVGALAGGKVGLKLGFSGGIMVLLAVVYCAENLANTLPETFCQIIH
ncbi:hypothetical protein F1B92_02510 [Campylobacter sp. FMV-PI01]|uniref:Uncharacterized protein n=1 Tax=Campylobacter portucalensis TaxID=2608384 RepID=A0A6L5WJ82_9BACT|nr:hypothetical protein [Campylobacter portucalensis]MSN96075.1 hypothetical protein [Campylobacter portucalensis]